MDLLDLLNEFARWMDLLARFLARWICSMDLLDGFA